MTKDLGKDLRVVTIKIFVDDEYAMGKCLCKEIEKDK